METNEMDWSPAAGSHSAATIWNSIMSLTEPSSVDSHVSDDNNIIFSNVTLSGSYKFPAEVIVFILQYCGTFKIQMKTSSGDFESHDTRNIHHSSALNTSTSSLSSSESQGTVGITELPFSYFGYCNSLMLRISQLACTVLVPILRGAAQLLPNQDDHRHRHHHQEVCQFLLS